MTPSYWIMGYREVSVCAEYAAELLDVCRAYGLAYADLRPLDGGGIKMRVALPVAKRLFRICEERGIEVSLGDTRGLPSVLRRVLKRPGLIVGAALGVVLLLSSLRVVWDVRVEGNSLLSSREVEETLLSCGFGVGSSTAGIELDKLENRVLLADRRIAWISVNLRGTVAYVQIREAQRVPREDTSRPANVVASRGGVIERVELAEGNVVVAAGDRVGEGDLLVSGIYDSAILGLRTTRASARVYARTVREIEVSVPFSYEQKVYDTTSDAASVAYSINFFGKIVNFSKSTGNEGVLCDTIERKRSLGLVSGVGFPVTLDTVWYLPYEIRAAEHTYAEAEELAYRELARRIGEIPGGAEILQKTITTRTDDGAFYLSCSLLCMEDIARVQEFEVDITP